MYKAEHLSSKGYISEYSLVSLSSVSTVAIVQSNIPQKPGTGWLPLFFLKEQATLTIARFGSMLTLQLQNLLHSSGTRPIILRTAHVQSAKDYLELDCGIWILESKFWVTLQLACYTLFTLHHLTRSKSRYESSLCVNRLPLDLYQSGLNPLVDVDCDPRQNPHSGSVHTTLFGY
jgi:hypothetical protein